VRGLKSKYKESDIGDVFGKFGEITDIKLNEGYAFIEYKDSRSARKAIEKLNGTKNLTYGTLVV